VTGGDREWSTGGYQPGDLVYVDAEHKQVSGPMAWLSVGTVLMVHAHGGDGFWSFRQAHQVWEGTWQAPFGGLPLSGYANLPKHPDQPETERERYLLLAGEPVAFSKRVPLSDAETVQSKTIGCCICQRPITCFSATTPHPESPEMIQLPLGAWVGVVTDEEAPAQFVFVCSAECRSALLSE
jgi:hypothetical protein